MPSEHYMVEAKLLLGSAADDVPRADEIKTIVKDIWDNRMAKLRSSMDSMIRNSSMYAAVDNLTLMEINSIRPILPHALNQLYRMKMVSLWRRMGMGLMGGFGQQVKRGLSQGSATLTHTRTAVSFTGS